MYVVAYSIDVFFACGEQKDGDLICARSFLPKR